MAGGVVYAFFPVLMNGEGWLEEAAGLAGRAERYRSGQTGQTVNLLA